MKNLFYRNWIVLFAAFCLFFGLALIELLNKEERLGFRPVDSWSILSPFGKFCAIMCGIVFFYAMLGALIRDPKKKRK